MMAAAELDRLIARIPLWIASDPTSREIAEVIATLSGVARKDPERVLRVFVFAYNVADSWAAYLKDIADPVRRGEMFSYTNNYITNKLNASDFVESGLQAMVVMDPDYIPALLKTAMKDVASVWSSLTDPRHKAKFVRDVLDSPKGYSKTARTIVEWRKPAEVNFAKLLDDWLESAANQSIYDVNVTGQTRSRVEWMRLGHAAASQGQKDMMWFNLIGVIIAAADLSTESPAEVKIYLRDNFAVLVHKLDGLVSAVELTQLLNVRIDAIWRDIMG